jgi:hypothetical protein
MFDVDNDADAGTGPDADAEEAITQVSGTILNLQLR